jgi:type IV pilus assembly protein PilM
MASSFVGIDIGHGSCNLAVHEGDSIRLISSRMPENLVDEAQVPGRVVAPSSMVDFLRGVRRDEHIKARDCALGLKESDSFFRHVTLPAMSAHEVELNLPHEFRDYINDDPADYVFDYLVDEVVNDEEGKPERLELFAVAARRDHIESSVSLLRKAGFRVKVVTPLQLAYARLLRAHGESHPADAEACVVFIDIGHLSTPVTLFVGSRFAASKVIEFGCESIDQAIADERGVDDYTAGNYRRADFEGVLETDAAQAVYDQLAIEVNKVVNYFNFDSPDRDVEYAYVLGGGSRVAPLVSTLASTISIPIHDIDQMLPTITQGSDNESLAALALGAMLEGEAI